MRYIQKCDAAKSACDELQLSYARKTITNKRDVLNRLLYSKLLGSVDIVNYISLHESQFSKLESMRSNIEEQKKMAILINFWTQKTKYSAIITSIYTRNEKADTWNYMSMIFFEEQKRTQITFKSMSTAPREII